MFRKVARSAAFLLFVGTGATRAADPALATAAAARGDCAGAEREARVYLQKRTAAQGEPYRLVATCYIVAAQNERAKTVLREGIAAAPRAADLQRTLGELLFREDPNSAEAGRLLRQASEANPGDPEAAHYLAQWAYVNRENEICVRKEQAALRAPGLNPVALLQMYTLLGMCQNSTNDVENARASFAKAHAVNLKQPVYDAMATHQYVQLLTRLGADAEAAQLVDEILQRSPMFGPAHLERAKRLENDRNPAEAIQEARTALAGNGNDDETERGAHALLARCYFATGDLTAAEREQQWIQEHPNHAARR